MNILEKFRIYPTQESFAAQSSDWTEITGDIDFEKSALITSDGKQYRLNFSKYSLNDPWEDMDFNTPISRIVWFIPLDDYKWRIGSEAGIQYYGFKENNNWYLHTNGNTVGKANNFIPADIKRSYRRCLKVIRSNGVDSFLMCFPWESPKFIIEQAGPKKIRHTQMTKDQDQMPTAYVDDENQEEVIGYIYPAP